MKSQIFSKMSEFTYIQRLGTGSFGSVNLYLHNSSKRKYAIKQIIGENVSASEWDGIEREIKVQLRCHSPYILQLYDSFREDGNVNIVLEYAEKGNLFQYIQNNQLSDADIAKFFSQTCLGLQYMHDHNCFHRDIKPENLLLDENLNLKICDFGWCAENIHMKRKTFCGTYEYMAPEIVGEVMYDYRIDIWALGILLYELYHKSAPFRGKDYNEIAVNIKQGNIKFRASTPKEAQNLIQQILQQDPNHRPSIQQILQSPLLKKQVIENQENIQPKAKATVRYLSPKRPQSRLENNNIQNIQSQQAIKPRMLSPARSYVSPARRMKPMRQELKKPQDLRGNKDATKIVYMSLCNNLYMK